MTATSTHDTKRGEDVRARIAVLAEIPDLWAQTLDRLLDLAPAPRPRVRQRCSGRRSSAPGRRSRERIHAYAEKAMREAGERTTWTDADAAYEKAVHAAVDAAYDDPRVGRLLDDLVARIAGPGWSNALSAKLVALTVPGRPGRLPGLGAVGADARRPRQPAAGRLRRAARGARPGQRRRATGPDAGADDHGHAKLLVTQAALTAAAEPAPPIHVVRPVAPTVRRPTTCSPSTAAARSPSRPGCRSGSAARRLGRHRAARCPRASGPTCSPAASYTGDAPLTELLADLPVALLIRRTRPSERSACERVGCHGASRSRSGPRPARVRLAATVRRRGRRDAPRRRRLVEPRRPTCRARGRSVDYGYLLDDTDTPRPDPRSRRQPRASTSARGPTTRRRSPGPTRPGPADSWPAR